MAIAPKPTPAEKALNYAKELLEARRNAARSVGLSFHFSRMFADQHPDGFREHAVLSFEDGYGVLFDLFSKFYPSRGKVSKMGLNPDTCILLPLDKAFELSNRFTQQAPDFERTYPMATVGPKSDYPRYTAQMTPTQFDQFLSTLCNWSF